MQISLLVKVDHGLGNINNDIQDPVDINFDLLAVDEVMQASVWHESGSDIGLLCDNHVVGSTETDSHV